MKRLVALRHRPFPAYRKLVVAYQPGFQASRNTRLTIVIVRVNEHFVGLDLGYDPAVETKLEPPSL